MFEWIREFLVMFLEYLKPWVLVNEYDEAVILRKGKYKKTLSPGLYYKHPIIEYHLALGVKSDTMEFLPIAITTLDARTIIIGLQIEFDIVNSRLYLCETNDARSNMRDIARGEMSDLLEDMNWGDIKKKTTKNALKRILSGRYEEMGVRLKDLKFTNKCESKAYRLFSDKELIS